MAAYKWKIFHLLSSKKLHINAVWTDWSWSWGASWTYWLDCLWARTGIKIRFRVLPSGHVSFDRVLPSGHVSEVPSVQAGLLESLHWPWWGLSHRNRLGSSTAFKSQWNLGWAMTNMPRIFHLVPSEHWGLWLFEHRGYPPAAQGETLFKVRLFLYQDETLLNIS